MGMMQSANIVPPNDPAGQPDPAGQTDAGQTLLVNRKGSAGKVIITVIAVLLGTAAAIFVAVRLFGGGGSDAVADASHVETKAEKPAVSTPDAPVSACQGDL